MRSPTGLEHVMPSTTDSRWKSIEEHSPTAFALAGLLILASLVAPIGLGPVVQPSWAVGIVLVGLAVLAIAVGVVGLYPTVRDRGRRLALAGVLGSGIAAVAALGLIGLVGIALAGGSVLGLTVVEPMRVFAMLGLSMAGGFAIAFLAVGAATLRGETATRTVGGLLAAGGAALLVPVIVEIVGLGAGIETPAWLLFPVIAFLAVDALAIGYQLHARGRSRAA